MNVLGLLGFVHVITFNQALASMKPIQLVTKAINEIDFI